MIQEAANEKSLADICRPDRFGNGKFMTVALVYKGQWLGKDDQIVDTTKVIQTLEKYKKFLKDFKNIMDI